MELWPFLPLVAALPVAVALAGWWLVRYFSQRQADLYRATYELVFPRGMTHEHVIDFVRSVVSQLQRPTMFKPAYAVSFEKYADVNGKRYYLHIPGHVHAQIDKLAEKKIDGVSIEQATTDLVHDTSWTVAQELGMHGTDTFFIVDAKSTASSIDVNFDHLGPDEALVLQWVIIPGVRHKPAPEEKDKLVDHTLHAVARIGATGEDAKQNLLNLRSSLTSINAGETRLHTRQMRSVGPRIQRRAGTFGYPIYLNVPEFTALMGWELDGAGAMVARKLQPTAMHDTEGIILGASNHAKSRGRLIAMPHDAGDRHIRVTGATGTGKSNFLLHYGLQAMMNPEIAFFLLEPAGDLARDFLQRIPDHRVKDVIYFDPLDKDWPIGLNPLRGTDPEIMADHMVSVFRHLSKDTWSPQMRRVFYPAILTSSILELTLYDTLQMLVNEAYRREQLRKLSRQRHPDIFQEWDWITERHNAMTDSAVVRLMTFLASRSQRNMLSQKDGLDFALMLREHKILLAPLTARMGEENARATGQIIREMIVSATMKQPENNRQRSVMMMDEFQNYADYSTSSTDVFAEFRKLKQQQVIAHQFSKQLKEMQTTVDRNVATQITFRQDFTEAKEIKDRYAPLGVEDLSNLPNWTAAAKIYSSGGLAPTVTFSTLPPPPLTHHEHEIIDQTRKQFARPVAEIDAEVMTRHKAPERRKRPEIERLED